MHEVGHVLGQVLGLPPLAALERGRGEGPAQRRPLAGDRPGHREPGQGAHVALHQVHLAQAGHPLDVESLPGQVDGGDLPGLAGPARHGGTDQLVVEKQQPAGLGPADLARTVELQLLDVVLPQQDPPGLALTQLAAGTPELGLQRREK